MQLPISEIAIYANTSVLGAGGHLDYISNTHHTFPITNLCERSNTLMGDDYVKLSFKLEDKVIMPAFSFLFYDSQLFFLREDYRPTPKGGYYEYNVKFVSFANMLNKPIFYRHVEVDGEDWYEPETTIYGTLTTLSALIIDSIHATANRYTGTFAALLTAITEGSDTKQNTDLENFTFSEMQITDVLNEVVGRYELEWWIETSGTPATGITQVLHFSKCERGTTLNVSDAYELVDGAMRSKGLLECNYSQEWTGIPQRVQAYGSERNITRSQAIVNNMYVSYGKRLRLDENHSVTWQGEQRPTAAEKAAGITGYYIVKNKSNVNVLMAVTHNGTVKVDGVTTGEEVIAMYDDIYPSAHYKVMAVGKRVTTSSDGDKVTNEIYTIKCRAVDSAGNIIDDDTILNNIFPIDIQDGETLSIHFESGLLNGREFEVTDKSAKLNPLTYKVDANGKWFGIFEIVPDGDNNESAQIPFGTFIPHTQDKLMVFNMKMPQGYITDAQQELAQKAYEEIEEALATRPEVKCVGDPFFFLSHDVYAGLCVSVVSELFGENASTNAFVSRIVSYAYSLTAPHQVSFNLASSQMQGTISAMQYAIADHTQNIQDIGANERVLSRRGWLDAAEMKNMLDTLAAEMMLVGNAKYQFAFTMGIACANTTTSTYTSKFDKLAITSGQIQHTQEPYVSDASGGLYTVQQTDLRNDYTGNALVSTTPYYLYAAINTNTGVAEMKLYAEAQNGDNFLLLGILSSEFDDTTGSARTSTRVFNRTNGYTQIAGGTITTEQIQDPTRQLIIDLSSNPPRIIACRGAEIIGKIKFLSGDEYKDLNNEVNTLTAGVASAQTTANSALTEASKIIGGENLIGEKMPLSIVAQSAYHYKIIVGQHDALYAINSAYLERGKTYVFSGKATLVSGTATGFTAKVYNFANDRNVSKDIPFGTFNETFTVPDYDGNYCFIIYVGIAGSCLGNSVRWENLMLQEGEKSTQYQAYIKSLTDGFENAARDASTEVEGGLIATSLIQMRDPNTNQVNAGLSGVTKDKNNNNENILMWGGATYAQALYAALNDYRKSAGGELIQTLIKKDGTGKIGIFYIYSDRVEVKTYDNGGNLIGTVVLDPFDGFRIKDSNGKDKCIFKPTSISNYHPLSDTSTTTALYNIYNGIASGTAVTLAEGLDGAGKKKLSSLPDVSVGSKTFEAGTTTTHTDEYDLTTTKTNTKTSISANSVKLNGILLRIFPEGTTSYVSMKARITVYVYVGNVIVASGHSDVTISGTSYLMNDLTISLGATGNCPTLAGSLEAHYAIEVSDVTTGTSERGSLTKTGSSMTAYATHGPQINYNQAVVNSYSYLPRTIMGTDGILTMVGNQTYFEVMNDLTTKTQKIYAKGLPTSATGLDAGQIYKSNGTLKIV